MEARFAGLDSATVSRQKYWDGIHMDLACKKSRFDDL
jgi:hypothetical protein